MGDQSKIEWTDATWNVVTGCTPIGAGCAHCYAKRQFPRVYSPRTFDQVKTHPERLEQPLNWRKPRRVFTCSMGDLFHETVTNDWIDRVWAVMAICAMHTGYEIGNHTFQVLTKRPARMREYVLGLNREVIADVAAGMMEDGDTWWDSVYHSMPEPLPNVWLGASASTQEDLERVVPPLLKTPAAVRFLSLEPLLGPINLRECCHVDDYHIDALDTPDPSFRVSWVIVGGESGPRARPVHPKWVRAIRDQCDDAGVPFFFKQWGEWAPDCIHPGDMYGDHDPCRTTPRPDRPTGVMFRCGKRRAGRKLDGKVWNQIPHIRNSETALVTKDAG